MAVLGSGQKKEFFDVGWTLVPDVFGARDLERMSAAFDRLEKMAQKLKESQLHKGSSFILEKRGTRTEIKRIVWCGAAEPVLLSYGADPRLLKMAAELLGSEEFDQLINQAHFKKPGDKTNFPWHQDIAHRAKATGDWKDVNGRGSYVQMLIPIDSMDEDNGPLFFIPHSPKLGRLPTVDTSEYSSVIDLSQEIATKAVPVVAPAGSVLLFGPYTIHGSFENASSHSRRVFINGYASPGANHRIYPGEGAGRRLKLPRR